ncbi:MAG: hypothetical protein PHU25_11505 [Deltaproteobacteria bacterium]|nr:hypothetical protein [Deltaproteobacteria bacterium]
MAESRTGMILALAALVAACDQNTDKTAISQFDRPQDLALVCYRNTTGKVEPLPMACCEPSGGGAEGYCGGGGIPEARILAFVTQTTPGEVAVVDVADQSIIDEDVRIPFNSFVPVGGQPTDIAASWDGSRVFTANYETEDLSVIEVGKSYGPTIVPATSIDVGGPAARLVIAQAPSIRDRFAFVTQPSLGRLAVVALDPADCPAAGEETPGCLLGYLRLDRATAIEHAPVDPAPEGIRPWAIVASKVSPSIYVGGFDGGYVAEIDSEILANEALGLTEPGPLSEGSVVRRLELLGDSGSYTTRSIAVEPDLERFLYAVENEKGGVIVVDLLTGTLLEVNEDNPLAKDLYSIELPGRARAVTMVRLGETGAPEPLTFDGTFAVVSTTAASIYVIDVDDRNAVTPYPHALRSSTDFTKTSPSLADEPVLTVDNGTVSGAAAATYASFETDGVDAGNADGGPGECGDGGVAYNPKPSYGVRLKCDPRQTSNEDWTLAWQGQIGLGGAAVINYSSLSADGRSVLLVDETKDFCAGGLLGRARGDTYGGFPGLEAGGGYTGDLLVITSEPTPAEDADCSAFEDKTLVYQVSEIVDAHTVRITNDQFSASSHPMPIVECFGQAFEYEIKAFRHWVLTGSSTGHLFDGHMNVEGQCVPGPLEAKGKTQRVFEGVPFESTYMAFTLMGGEKDGTEMSFAFTTEGGFAPLGSIVGNNITDMEFTPLKTLLLVDQAAEGLVTFDFLGDFVVVGTSVN